MELLVGFRWSITNSDMKQILKEAIRERFIKRADVGFILYLSGRLNTNKPAMIQFT